MKEGSILKYYLAVDIGASSGRHILSSIVDGKIVLEEIYRFDNKQIRKNNHDCWDIDYLFDCIINGLKECKKIGKIPHSIGIDTWAVDFVLVDKQGNKVSDSVAYRDERTKDIKNQLEQSLPFEEHYSKIGIQYQPFNTVYQLLALQNEAPEQLKKAHKMLMIPDYFNFLLTGKMIQEYTNATSTALINAQTNTWDFELIERLGLNKSIFADIKMAGYELGDLSEAVQKNVGFNCKVVLPATHDTGSAFLAVPATTDTAVYISSGTWSLLGVELDKPITTKESMQNNFTNEGGYNYKYRYLKNIMGLWMIQSIRRELNGVNYIDNKEQREKSTTQYSFARLCDMAQQCTDFQSVVDVDNEAFLSPPSMIDAVKKQCEITNQKVPSSIGELMQCVYFSLAKKYASAIENLSKLTGKTYTCIHIVGGGCKDDYLSQLCAKETGLKVYAGPVEATALGNCMVQFLADKRYENIKQIRAEILNSFEVKEIN